MLDSRHDYTPVLQPADLPSMLAQAALAFGRCTQQPFADIIPGALTIV